MAATADLPLSVLDFVGIEHGEPASEAIAGAVEIARAVEDAGYRRYWVSEHHNMENLACSAPEILLAHLGAKTDRIRVGAAGIMLPNHAPFKVAEVFRTLLAMYPGRIDLGLGRAPGTDPLTAHVLRRGAQTDVAREFPGQVAELLAFLGAGPAFPDGHPYRQLVAAPVVEDRPEVFMLGSSPYGPQFAAVNGLAAVFAHHQSPDLAVDLLRHYRRDFAPATPDARPWSAMSVLAFASDDEDAVLEFEAAWALTMRNLSRNRRTPLRPEEVTAFARSAEFLRHRRPQDPRAATGPAKEVVARLADLKEQAEADEIVVVTPSLDRERRIASYRAIAEAWPSGA
ncbi:LLM class flavin-dependent oxidoreductase [Nocardioides massiliensis]|uniref:Luciferase family oxidoreductase group 1 n=1 Tax=Nocardioides massiliensis TaxID=1325935 RepID=A0ABT9NKG9_9ACTN|nr:LLM class flavin-dependent oxidoreductase [Nocardioides massiliensis]MDP9820916.1 luciferase family oxidoreductase group 1 [Nocardioides massiliensis]